MTWTINLSGHVPQGQELEVEDAAREFVQRVQHLGLAQASCSTMGKGYINLLAATADEGPGTGGGGGAEPPPDEGPGTGGGGGK